ncbi:MAG TPA: hypothetical protein VMZ28_29995 [Kofleriaceae bacterium]|nr:hypothetical protein [Kofleriaceae bacterium]
MRRLATVGLICVVLAPAAAHAQTMKEKVKEHVDKNLEGKDKKKKKKKSTSTSPTRNRPATGGESSAESGPQGEPVELELADDAELAADREKLPHRILPGGLALDLRVDGAWRGWVPQQYRSAEVDIAGYATWSLAVKVKPFSWLTLYQLRYESNGLNPPRNHKATVAQQVGTYAPKAAWLLAWMGLTFFKEWQPMVRYEARSFTTTATPKQPVCIVDREDSGDLMDCPLTEDRLRMISAYESLIAGVLWKPRYGANNVFATYDRTGPPLYAGVGLLSYHKPYQVTIGGDTLEEYLFDGRFRGAGLALGGNFGGGPRRFFADVDFQIGLGEVSLTDDFTLNEVAPDDWLIGYVQGNLNLGYKFVLYRGPPTIYFQPSASAGGASFHFVRTSASEGDMGEDSSPNLNWDFFYSGRGAIEFAF